MKITKIAGLKPVNPEEIIALIDSLRIYRQDHTDGIRTISKELVQRIDLLPSHYQVNRRMGNTELTLLRESLADLWKKVVGKDLPKDETIHAPQSAKDLDGNFWMIPGGMMLKGINHYSAAKNHKNLLCSILNINPWIFEKKLYGNPHEFIKFIIQNGGVRVNINRADSEIICQSNEASWATVVDKLRRMYHKKKVSKVIDPKRPYLGWVSGVPIIVG